MIPVTYPSSVSTSKESQMVVFALSSVAGLQRWTDYIPVKFQSSGTANSFNTDGYLACDFLTSSSGKQSWVDYIPVFVDVNATDAWQVSATGFIPFNTLAGGGLGSSLDFNFVATGTLDPSITFTRASTATYFDSAGVLQSASNNVARFDYNPATLAARGLLIEEQRTNSIRNNTMQGAVAGTPGSSPTNWGATTSNPELALSVVGVGTESGIAYIDLRINGTVTAARTLTVSLETSNSVAAANGQTWIQSAYLRQVGGSQTNISSIYFQANTYTAAVAYVNSPWSASGLTVTTSGLATQRFTAFGTLSGATIAFIQPYIVVVTAASGAVDFTLRIGLPQLEQGAFATSVIPTTTTALTRSADVASSPVGSWFNATEGTLYAEFTRGYTGNFSNFVSPAIITNNLSGASSNSISSVVTNGVNQQLYNSMVVNNVEQLDYRARNAQTTNKGALAYKTNDTQQFINGLAEIADTSCTVPTSVSQMNIGAGAVTNAFINSWIRRITYYPRRLSQAEGIAITT